MSYYQHKIKERTGHEGRATVIAKVKDLHGWEFVTNHIPLYEAIQNLQDALMSIPIQLRDAAFLNIQVLSDNDYASLYADVTFERPETDDEMKARQDWVRGFNKDAEDRDRVEFERLKLKYGN